ncbi:MAG TPA: hypothetical protein VKX16_10665 [Chloroflexota bacterium]|nr:hypothetical protein [Chloroflexota bacterium]
MTAKTIRALTSVLALSAVMAMVPTETHAASLRIQATSYPPHTRLTQLSPLSNSQMDCDWSFTCANGSPVTSAPVFHFNTQDELHRLTGWAQFGDSGRRATRMLFAVFASRYSTDDSGGLPWNVRAFSDFRTALMAQRYRDISRVPPLLPAGQVGNTSEQLASSASGDVVAMACWTGSIEVEGLAVYAHGSKTQRHLAVRYLARQIRVAVSGT